MIQNKTSPVAPVHAIVHRVIAALFVDPTGTYSDLGEVDLWGEDRDARLYRGPHRVIAHPPCQSWGKFWHGSTAKDSPNRNWK